MQVNPGVAAAGPLLFQSLDWTEAAAAMQTVGDLEVSFFMVALFVSLLIAHLNCATKSVPGCSSKCRRFRGPCRSAPGVKKSAPTTVIGKKRRNTLSRAAG